ncbi:hypothetical protein D3C78_1085970 [compost metagenome]
MRGGALALMLNSRVGAPSLPKRTARKLPCTRASRPVMPASEMEGLTTQNSLLPSSSSSVRGSMVSSAMGLEKSPPMSRLFSVPTCTPLNITGVRPGCRPLTLLSCNMTLNPASAASKSSYRRKGMAGSVGGLSSRCSGVAKAMPPVAMLTSDSARSLKPDRPPLKLMPPAFQNRVCLRIRCA